MSEQPLTEGERLVKLETQVDHLGQNLDRLNKSLKLHMEKEERDRRDLDKKLNLQTYIMIGIAGSYLGPEYVPKLIGLVFGVL
jgi:glucose-6-phosphate isomerase